MSTAYPRVEAGGVKQLTVQYSAAPSTPVLTLYAGSGSSIIVGSGTVQSSSSTDFYAFVTMPISRMVVGVEWVASFTSGPVVDRFCVQVVHHGS